MNDKEYKIAFEKCYINVSQKLMSELENAKHDECAILITVLQQISIKQAILAGLNTKKDMKHVVDNYKKHYEYLIEQYENTNKLLFSKELQDKLKPFDSMNVEDFLSSKEAITALCEFAGMEKEKIQELLNR